MLQGGKITTNMGPSLSYRVFNTLFSGYFSLHLNFTVTPERAGREGGRGRGAAATPVLRSTNEMCKPSFLLAAPFSFFVLVLKCVRASLKIFGILNCRHNIFLPPIEGSVLQWCSFRWWLTYFIGRPGPFNSNFCCHLTCCGRVFIAVQNFLECMYITLPTFSCAF